MVAAGDERRARRRAERGGVEIRVAQPALRDAIQGRRRDDAAKGARRAEAGIVGHDEQHVRRALRRHDARRPPRFRLRGLLLDHPAELRIGRRKLFSVDRGRGAGRTLFFFPGGERPPSQGGRTAPCEGCFFFFFFLVVFLFFFVIIFNMIIVILVPSGALCRLWGMEGTPQPTRLPLQLWWHACRVRNGMEEGDKIPTGFVRLIRSRVARTKSARGGASAPFLA